jgi:peptidoglycan biosynthesis protein MviN/MurJ (putative lipid II flippase)
VQAAINHIGFNWTAYFRARGDTRPMAVAAVGSMIAFLLIGLPLLFLFGLTGFALAVGVQGFVNVLFRAYYLRRLFHGFAFMRHAMRAFIPTIPAALVVLALRVAESGGRSLGMALGELFTYLAVTGVVTWLFESRLLREAAGYVRPGRAAQAST